MQTKIDAVLNSKGRDVWSLSPESTVHDAIRTMADRRVQALLVMSQDRLVGIVTERDCARQVTLQGKPATQVRVREIMSSPVVFVTPAHTVADGMRIATQKGIAHLPVLAGDVVTGVVTVGDLVRSIVSDQDTTIHHLEAYITGTDPG